MELKSLILQKNLREEIIYNNYSLPLASCTDNFDDYLQNEWSCHWHDELEFGIIQKGCAQFTIYKDKETTTHILNPGDGIFINSGCLHSARSLAPDTVISEFVISAAFPGQILRNISEQYSDPITTTAVTHCIFNHSLSKEEPLLSGIRELCFILEEEPDAVLHIVEIVCRIWRLLTCHIIEIEETGALNSVNQAQEERLKQMLSYIHSHYSEKITVNQIAASASVSRTECFRCFHVILKKTPAEYLEDYRLSMSIVFLSDQERSISDIAMICGFNSISYFCKRFRERYGTSPNKFKNQYLFSDCVL